MAPKELTQLLLGLNTAADVVEAIDDQDLQRRHGWDLSGWRYSMVPWGVRFTYQERPDARPVEVFALLRLENSCPAAQANLSTVLVLG
jgi:hypothetical protein